MTITRRQECVKRQRAHKSERAAEAAAAAAGGGGGGGTAASVDENTVSTRRTDGLLWLRLQLQ